jgi:glycosyltransferase involved in cell wall biosynthesis
VVVRQSFPLTLIQAMQVGTPIVATDIGEIATMMTVGDERAGLLAPLTEDDEVFVANFSSLMEEMLDPAVRLAFSRVALAIGRTYDIDDLGKSYYGLYRSILARRYFKCVPSWLVAIPWG